ncbi:hypothetical protein A3709_02415 [Halioglobus sp. HI00S01]|uniref:O-linked N-acetylglucosamine transferase, SPINDLY family protein n=1 Tax=Halioglobus sp. HI00S01 TaxID=1822214 RepID=UPI0007C3A3A0|nr:tetratricopeptide repeat protein [Halioglobus sp. HI00S01]KZX58334.1 hypothetical protein A3709_02415 [Halioglobus sp. HI00S01]
MSINVNKSLRRAKSLAHSGNLHGAAEIYHGILERFPGNKQARTELASLGLQSGKKGAASVGAPRELVFNAVKLYEAGRLKEALAQAKQLSSRYANDPMIDNFLGVVNSALGNAEAAVDCYTRAIDLKPDYAEVYRNLGVALQQLGRHSQAAEIYAKAIRLEPANAQAHYGLASALKETGEFEKAVTSYSRAIKLQPNYAAAYNNLGNTLQFLNRYHEAIRSFSRSVELDPVSAEAHANLGHVYSVLDRHEEAIASYTAALKYNPRFDDARAKLLHRQSLLCEWGSEGTRASLIAQLGLTKEVVEPFSMLAQDDDPQRQRQRARLYARKTFGQYRELSTLARPKDQLRRMKIGYFSADFHNHATMFLMAKMFEVHDSERFSIHAFSFAPDHDDTMGKRLQQTVDVFHDVRHLGEQAIAELARAEGIDIAVDLKGYTKRARTGIFAYRAAPVQISYLGYPGTMGMPSMDYLVADPVLIPENERTSYSENIIYLPHSYQVNDNERVISQNIPTRAEEGLPETGFVFCCFNNSYKITPREFDIWMRLLGRVPGSVLWLLDTGKTARENLRREAQQRGIDPQRLVMAQKLDLADHLARHCLADLFLDTFAYNAHTTASDALWAGLPVITRLGRSMAARVGASLLQAVNLPDLVTHSDEEYEQLALTLAANPERLADLRGRLADNRLSTPLFDTELFTRHLEQAYQQAYQRFCDGKAPATLFV